LEDELHSAPTPAKSSGGRPQLGKLRRLSPIFRTRARSGEANVMRVIPIETGKARMKTSQMTGRDGRGGIGRKNRYFP
jgi:hypothetical protein